MKTTILFAVLLLNSIAYSQNTYNMYIVKKPNTYQKPTTYRNPISTLDVARETSNVQSQLQQRYNYNYERFSNTLNEINSQIYSLNVNREIKDRIINRWNRAINAIDTKQINFTSNSQVTNYINVFYELINKIIHEETE